MTWVSEQIAEGNLAPAVRGMSIGEAIRTVVEYAGRTETGNTLAMCADLVYTDSENLVDKDATLNSELLYDEDRGEDWTGLRLARIGDNMESWIGHTGNVTPLQAANYRALWDMEYNRRLPLVGVNNQGDRTSSYFLAIDAVPKRMLEFARALLSAESVVSSGDYCALTHRREE